MNFFVKLLLAVSIASVQAQDNSKKIFPVHLLEASKTSIKTAPSVISSQKIQYAIDNPFGNVADAASYFDPDFAPIFHKCAGFNVPLNRSVFASLLKKALSEGKSDKLTIVTIVFASIEVPPTGLLKKVALYVAKEFLCKIAQSGLLPGLENNVSFIMRTVEANNKIPDNVSQNVISVSGDIPFIAGYLRGAGKEFYNTLIIEVARIYGDDPQRAINAFISFLKHDGSPKTTCTPSASQKPNTSHRRRSSSRIDS